ncbi:hypothetical protein [Altererythrobacter sp. GH1-8]|uniref:hypothetical protein n=1 Tax=Altererythrobacter sp. GH1-8 TaxID=3349333 RepID=UPI00374CB762
MTACTAALAEPGNPPVQTTPQDLQEPKVKQLQNAKPHTILFVGNSYFYYNDSLHNHVQRMAAAAGVVELDELTYKSATIGGAALRDHAIEHLLEPSNLRVDTPYEVVILQGGSFEPLSENRRKLFIETARDYAARVRASGAEPVLYMTHAYVPPHRNYRSDMIQDVASLYLETGNAIDALVIPVGVAFAEAYRRNPKIELHKSFDGSHPSLLGTYLATAVTFASLYQTSPIGNSYDYFGAVSEEDARFLQQVAHDTVSAFYGRED